MTTGWNAWKQKLNRFFYEEEVPYALAMMRMAIPVVMLFMVIPRWPVARELFSADGAPSQLSVNFGHGNLFPVFSGEVVVALMTLLVFTSITAAIGWHTRISMFLTWVLFTYFAWMDSVSTTTKYTSIATHFFFLLTISPCGAVWSVDAWLANYRRQSWPGLPSIDWPKFPVWPRRMIQFFMGVVYFGAAITKLQTPSFITGDELQAWMMTHINYRHPIGEYLAMYPALLMAFCYIALVWEVLFIFLIWEKTFWRPLILAVGVCFHFMTTLTLGLLIFPATCYSLYLAFVEPEDVQRAAATFRGLCRRFKGLGFVVARCGALLTTANPFHWRNPARIAFVATAVLAMIAGLALEYQMDPYGERRPEGRHQLAEMDPEMIQQMLAPTPALRDVDKFFSIDTGSMLMGDILADRRVKFRQGERLIAQCHLIAPHEDMWIEFHLLDSGNRLVTRIPQVATREMFRIHLKYDLTEAIEPGNYTVVIQTAGREVLRKPIEVLASKRSAVAN